MRITCTTKADAARHATNFLETALKEKHTVRIVNTSENSLKLRIFSEDGQHLVTVTIGWKQDA